MKIVFLTRRFWPEIGGVEKHVLEVGKRLIEMGHRLVVISEKTKNQSSSTDNISGITITRINPGIDNWFKKFRIWRELWKHRHFFKEADVIHCHDVFFWYFPFRFIYPTKPVYVTFHGYEGNQIPSKRAIFSHKLAEIFSRGNICIGSFYKKWYGTDGTIINYGATDPKKNITYRKPEKIKRLLFAGRLEKETGIMEYLGALKIINNRMRFTFQVLGDGSLRKEAEEFCKQNKINAKFHGFVKDVDKYIKETDYVFVSRYLGILETLVLKKPVFAAYNNKIKKDYLQMAPFSKFIYIEKNAEEIAVDLLKKVSAEKIEEGYRWAVKQTWYKLINDYLKLWSIPS